LGQIIAPAGACVVIDQRIQGSDGLDVAGPVIIDRNRPQALPSSPTEPVLTTPGHLRDRQNSIILRELPVPLTHTPSCVGILSQEGDSPQDGLASAPQDLLDTLGWVSEGHIKQFPGYLQTFNLHHLPP
jgi:hypothetical protein